MPSTEKTWRDLRLMHAVFAVSCVAMLWTTLWMFSADHNREWKGDQRTFRQVEVWSTQARMARARTPEYFKREQELDDELAAARREVPDRTLIERFDRALNGQFADGVGLYERLAKATSNDDRTDLRADLVALMQKRIKEARFRETEVLSRRKAENSYFDVARSQYESAVEQNRSPERLAALEQAVEKVRATVARLTLEVEAAKTYRLELEGVLALVQASETKVLKAKDEHEVELKRLAGMLSEQQIVGLEPVLEWPILDAFNSPIKPKQIWLPKLTINYNFRDVPRFDRCTTCHQGIDRAVPGSLDPAYPHEVRLAEPLVLQTPARKPKLTGEGDEAVDRALLAEYGLGLSHRGLLHDGNVTVNVVKPESSTAKAKLQVGDVIERIVESGSDTKILARGELVSFLLETAKWGTPLRLGVRRGLPHPYASHPRLDLYLSSTSPHKMGDVGCTICHDGQGSATEFKWASHTPNTPTQADEWKLQHGWFDNHHWIFPIPPKRFAQSLCLKCHHEVVELEPSERFPDPPAPKLVAGYNLIRTYGCFGCHEINGFDGPTRRIGPDLRAEPNYSAAAQGLLASGALLDAEKPWAERLVQSPQDTAVRRRLLESLRNAKALAKDDPLVAVRSAGATTKLINLLADVESPGQFRKVGPSLRHVSSKVDFNFLYAWIANPLDFRPNTRMPRFFGLHNHLPEGTPGLAVAEKYEPIEIRAIAEYLLAKSGRQKFEYVGQPADVTEQPSAERGKKLFRNRGCLACHQHKDFPAANMTQGPDLSNVGAKLTARSKETDGGQWLYSWLRNPSHYNPRTRMPDLKLDPIDEPDGKKSDPVADLTEYLLGSSGWKPSGVPARKLSDTDKSALHDLALEYLHEAYSEETAERYLKSGIPESRREQLKGDEVELVVSVGAAADRNQTSNNDPVTDRQLQYVGRRAISKYGCSGCHDIPGLEDVKPIGTGLADWGRKAPDKLAFEQIVAYLTRGPGAHELGAHSGGDEAASAHAGEEHELDVKSLDPDTGFYMEQLLGHQRTGFIWQKLREPRSYDYMKTENKRYNERLRMPQFNLTADEREAVITFVLGLVSEPPAQQFVYKPTPRRRAIVEGSKVLDKYNCAGCHTLKLERWNLAFAPGTFSDPSEVIDYPFLLPRYTPEQIEASAKRNVEGKYQGTIVGMPRLDQDGNAMVTDKEGVPIEPDDPEKPEPHHSFVLWEDVLLGGKSFQAGIHNLIVPQSAIVGRYARVGGYLPNLIVKDVLKDERAINPQQAPNEAWAWLPPPLAGEGRKVQPDWLHGFLLDPQPIRPGVVLRMPKFNMSSAEATALVDYFAAVDASEYPYEYDQRTNSAYLAEQERRRPDRLKDALQLVASGDFCVQCHLVGDFVPQKPERGRGPQLADVYRRLRPDFAQRWIARPARILPYTGMPQNFEVNTLKGQDLFKGSSSEQVDALTDLLLNYDRYVKDRFSIKPLVRAKTPEAGDKPGEKTDAAQGASGR